jgi:hypothetical protein
MNDTTEPPVLAATNTTEIQPVSLGRSAFPGAPVRPLVSVAAIAASTERASTLSSDPDKEMMTASPTPSIDGQPVPAEGTGDPSATAIEANRLSDASSACEWDEKDINILPRMLSRSEAPESLGAISPGAAVLPLPAIGQFAEGTVARIETAKAPSWESPDGSLLADVDIPEPPVPSLFSHAIQSEFQSIAHSYSAPVAYVLASFLAAVAACLGNRMCFAAGPLWHEVCVVWSILVGPSGSRKSSVSRPYVENLLQLERQEALEWQESRRKAAHENLIASAEWQLHKAEVSRALRNGHPLPAAPEREPVALTRFLPQIIADDFTIPALVEKHAVSRTGLIMVSDEVTHLLKRVDSEGGAFERTFLLRAHDGGLYRSDRVSRTVPMIDSLAISILGGIPTNRLRQLLGPIADGFAARCLWIACDDSGMVRIALEDTRAQIGSKVLPTLRSLARKADVQIVLPLDRDGIIVLQQAAQRWHGVARQTQGQIGSWYARAAGQALRLAGLRELCEWALTGNQERPLTISAASMQAAINAVDTFFAPMAQRVLGPVGGVQVSRDAAELARLIARDGELIINRRILQRNLPKRLKVETVFKEAFKALEKGFWVRPLPREEGDLGRPRADYEVNPRLVSSLA